MVRARAILIWYLVGLMAALTAVSFVLAGLTVDVRGNPVPLILIGALLGGSLFYRFARPDPRLQTVTETAGQMLLILLFGVLLTYAAVVPDFPYVDVELYAIDNALGFDRHAYLSFFAQHRWLLPVLTVAYLSMLPQFALVPVVMFSTRQVGRLQQMIVAFAIALMITALVSVFTPSLTAFVHVDLPQMAHIPAGLYTPEPTMTALRAGTFHIVHLDRLEGLVSFPSFHTAAALIFIWTLRKTPYVCWAALALNLMLIAATPVDGAHYFIDIVGGAVVALAAIGASAWLCRYVDSHTERAYRPQPADATASP